MSSRKSATLRRLAEAPLIYGGGQEWDHFDLRNLPLAPRVAPGKDAPEESRYLRAMQRDSGLRRHLLRAGASNVVA